MERNILTTNENYSIGDLSLFPEKLDDYISLYSNVVNSGICIISSKITSSSDIIYVNNNSLMPENGIIRINDELIYYKTKKDNYFTDLIRGFNGSRNMFHKIGSVVLLCVSSLHHNAIRDAIIKCQQKIGHVNDLPDKEGSLISKIKYIDLKWATPIARFFASPLNGHYPLSVNFRNDSFGGDNIRYLWDFGDDQNSEIIYDKNPTHIYYEPGVYDVTLIIQSDDGRSSKIKKKEYIKVYNNDEIDDVIAYAREIKTKLKLQYDSSGYPEYNPDLPLDIEFVDQTLGDIVYRKWNFGNGDTKEYFGNLDGHLVKYTYTDAGEFWPTLIVRNSNGITKTYNFSYPIISGVGIKITGEGKRNANPERFLQRNLGVVKIN